MLEEYIRALESGVIEVEPTTVVTSRSAVRTMRSIELPDGRRFESIRLTKLRWQDIEQLSTSMRLGGRGVDWIRRCATVLTEALELGRKR